MDSWPLTFVIELWELFATRDFRINLAAGLVIFVLDVGLIAVLLPRLIEHRRRRQWAPTRRAMVEWLTEWPDHLRMAVLQAIDILNLIHNRMRQQQASPPEQVAAHALEQWWSPIIDDTLSKLGQACQSHYSALLGEVAVYGPGLDTELTSSVSKYIRAAGSLVQTVIDLQRTAREKRVDPISEVPIGRTVLMLGARLSYDELLIAIGELNKAVGYSAKLEDESLTIVWRSRGISIVVPRKGTLGDAVEEIINLASVRSCDEAVWLAQKSNAERAASPVQEPTTQ